MHPSDYHSYLKYALGLILVVVVFSHVCCRGVSVSDPSAILGPFHFSMLSLHSSQIYLDLRDSRNLCVLERVCTG